MLYSNIDECDYSNPQSDDLPEIEGFASIPECPYADIPDIAPDVPYDASEDQIPDFSFEAQNCQPVIQQNLQGIPELPPEFAEVIPYIFGTKPGAPCTAPAPVQNKLPEQWGDNQDRRRFLYDEERNFNFAQQHYAYVRAAEFSNVIKLMDQLAYFKDGLEDEDYEGMIAEHGTLWAAAKVMAAVLELLRRNRWNHVFSADEILHVCADQQKRIANQLKRPKAPYIRKRDKLCANPGAEFVDDHQAMLAALAAMAKAGLFLITDDYRFEINPGMIATSYSEYMEKYTSGAGMSKRKKLSLDHCFQISLSPRTVEFMAYLAGTSYMDFWRFMAIMNLCGQANKEIDPDLIMPLNNYQYLFALTEKQSRANQNRGYARDDSRYWIDRYVKRGWLGHWTKYTPMKRLCGHLGAGGVIRNRNEKADRFEAKSYWIINPSIAVCFGFYDDNFGRKIGRFFNKAKNLLDSAIDIFGIFSLRHKKHLRYKKKNKSKVWNWDKYFGPRMPAQKPKSYASLKKNTLMRLAESIGLTQQTIYLNTNLTWLLN